MRYLLCIVVIVVLSACASSDSEPNDNNGVIPPVEVGSEAYVTGASVYNTQCAACHGINGEGQFPDAPNERDDTGRYGAPPHDGTGHTWHHDDDLLLRIVREGGMGDPANFYPMPALGDVLSEQEIVAVLGYIKTMWSPEQQAMQREQTIAARAQ